MKRFLLSGLFFVLTIFCSAQFLGPCRVTWLDPNCEECSLQEYEEYILHPDTVHQIGFLIEDNPKFLVVSHMWWVNEDELYIYGDTINKNLIILYEKIRTNP